MSLSSVCFDWSFVVHGSMLTRPSPFGSSRLKRIAMVATDMDPAAQALCYYYRNPPPESDVKPQPYKAIPKLIHQVTPNMHVHV